MTCRRNSTRFLAALALLVFAGAVLCQSQTQASCSFTRFTVPSGSSMHGMNSYKTIVGEAVSADGMSGKGFVRYSGGNFTYFSAPNSTFTSFMARNDNGVNVGVYGTSSFAEGFMLSGSTFTKIVDPNSALPYGTQAMGINKWNTVVGSYSTASGTSHGFRRYSNGSYANLDYPGAQDTGAAGINDNGVVVGGFMGNGGSHGFAYHNGQWAQLDYPNSFGATSMMGISNAGVILGTYTAPEPPLYFLVVNGTFKVLSDPAATQIAFDAISPNGLLVGGETLTDGTSKAFIATCK